uniref:Uncharacterized protein n=1 Tax=Biomphalaria glabrata TaxID=6526 RepID=A0A2C9LMY8_BIOGL
MDVDAQDIEDKKQVRRELAKLIKSNIESEKEMDSTSSDYDEIDSDTDSDKSSVKEKRFLKAKKSLSLRKFQKVALGLDVNTELDKISDTEGKGEEDKPEKKIDIQTRTYEKPRVPDMKKKDSHLGPMICLMILYLQPLNLIQRVIVSLRVCQNQFDQATKWILMEKIL